MFQVTAYCIEKLAEAILNVPLAFTVPIFDINNINDGFFQKLKLLDIFHTRFSTCIGITTAFGLLHLS